MREVWVPMAIDDFRTSYSSLAREKQVDCMKIDKQFIDRLLGTDWARNNKRHNLHVAQAEDCTIAEGVEHESQLNT